MPRKKDPTLAAQRGIMLTLRQSTWIKQEAVRLQTTDADVFRRALDDYIDRQERLVPRKYHGRKPRAKDVAGQEQMPLSQAA